MKDDQSTAHFLRRPDKPRYKSQYGVIVICTDERDQASVFRQLKRTVKPREIKVVVT